MEQKEMHRLLDQLVGKDPKKIRAMISLLEGLLEENQPAESEAYSTSERKQLSRVELEKAVTHHIHTLGVPAHIVGYMYLREAIVMAVMDSSVISAITKCLYPAVAKKYNSTPSRVERAIRHAVEVCWDRGDLDTMQEYFGYTISNTKGKPTNSEFIALLADKIQMDMKA